MIAYEIIWVRPYSKVKAKTKQEHLFGKLCLYFFPSMTKNAHAILHICKVACISMDTNCTTLNLWTTF